MPRRRRSHLSTQLAEVALAAPQVMAQRLGRMAMPGYALSSSDREEFMRMGSEKLTAFSGSWQAMAQQMWLAQQRLASSYLAAMCFPWANAWPGKTSLNRQFSRAAWATAYAGLAPVHRAVTANAKRLKVGR